jgi:hypothetical protein
VAHPIVDETTRLHSLTLVPSNMFVWVPSQDLYRPAPAHASYPAQEIPVLGFLGPRNPICPRISPAGIANGPLCFSC